MKASRYISFGSPKGGAGRTMVVANMAAMYANGSVRAGVLPCTVLVVDLDFEAPGIHFYDFEKRLGSSPTRFLVGRRPVSSWRGVLEAVSTTNLGLLEWLSVLIAKHEQDLGRASEGKTDREISDVARQILESNAGRPESPLDAENHIISIERDGKPALVLVPATDPGQPKYHENLLRFNEADFFGDQCGHAILHAFYNYLLARMGERAPQRVLLDQGCGFSIPGVVNRAYGDHYVVVSGLNEQHRAGLLGLLAPPTQQRPVPVSVVLSQYGARSVAARPGKCHADFLAADNARWSLQEELGQRRVPPENIHVIDFEPNAVQQEFWFESESESEDDVGALIVSIERDPGYHLQMSGSFQIPERLRVLGEYVAAPGSPPTGVLGAFSRWIEFRFPSCEVQTFAATHQEIVELVTKSGPSSEGRSGLECKKSLVSDIRGRVNDLRLEDFDIVAMPFYAAIDAGDSLETLRGFGRNGVEDSTSLGPVSDEWARATIHGWARYARLSDGRGVRGYPLFVDHEVIAIRSTDISSIWREQYFLRNARTYAGISEPADLLAVAQMSDSLLMPLKSGSVSRWYGWRTIMGMFGLRGDEVLLPSSEWSSTFCHAMEFYGRLCAKAHPTSNELDWDACTERFHSGEGTFLLRWPDAVPHEERRALYGIEWARPPGSGSFEECWLLAVPAKRSSSRPPACDVEALLQIFMTQSEQQRYLELGGIPVHRRVLRSINNWRSEPLLPALAWWQDATTALAPSFPKKEQILREMSRLEEVVRTWNTTDGAD